MDFGVLSPFNIKGTEKEQENLLTFQSKTFENIDIFSNKLEDEELKKLENDLRSSVLSLEKEIYDLKYENNKYRDILPKRKSMMDIQEHIQVEISATKVYFLLYS